jgi:hypothetical protein
MINRRQFVTNVAGLAIAGFTIKKANAAQAAPNSLQGSLNSRLGKSIFLSLVGETFIVSGRSRSPIPMKLLKVDDGNGSFGTEQFSVVFAGPRDVRFLEGIYTIKHHVAGTTKVLLQPRGKDAYNRYYEAPFNLLL